MKYRLTPEAFADLQQIHDYIAEEQRHPIAASNVVRSIENTLELIADNPLMGRGTRYPDTYEFAMGKLPFTIVYRLTGEIVQVITIFSQSRHPDNIHL